jgi:hypothetical protein
VRLQIDFACDINGEVENPDVAQVVYLGLHIITPLMSVDLLKYPKLCRQYFTLLAHMLEVYPEKVAKLSPDGFSRIVGTLDFGLHHQVHVCAVFTLPSCKVINTINRPIETTNKSYISWKYREPFLVCMEC